MASNSKHLKLVFQALPVVLGLCTACAVSIATDAPMPIPRTSGPLPTNTLIPTDVRKPVPTSTQVPTQPSSPPLDVQLYASEVERQLQTLTDAVQAIGGMAQNPELTSDTWKREVAVQLETIHLVHQELTKMGVPIEMIGIHSAVLYATSDCDFATGHVNRGIENLDSDDIHLATALMVRCREKMNVPLDMMNEYLDKWSLPVPSPLPPADPTPEPGATPTEPAPPAAPDGRPA